jgi:phenylacetate-CoA ligase
VNSTSDGATDGTTHGTTGGTTEGTTGGTTHGTTGGTTHGTASISEGTTAGAPDSAAGGGVLAGAAARAGRTCFDPENETLEPRALRALQLERLQHVVAAACERSAVYRAMCREAGVEPADVKSLDDVRRLPFLEKTALREAYPAGLRLCGLDEIIEVHSTSGTTGKPTPIWVTRREMEAWALRNARSMWMIGLRPGDLLQNCFGYGLPTSIGLQYGAQHAGIGVVPAGIGRQELLIDLIVDLGVTAICTTPSYGLYLADKAKERGIDLATDSQLRIGLFGAEPWPESGRDRLTAALGVDAFNEYGMGEFLGPGMACECPVKDGMHVWSDHLLVECIDPETCEPVADGQPGELVWTSLTSDSMAMIRYRSHDISSLSWAPCACGRTHPKIGRITGRSDDALSIGGLVVFPSQIEEVLVRFDEFGSNFCLVIDKVNNLDRLTLQAEIRGFDELSDDDKAQLARKLATGVKATVGVTPRMELHAPYSLPRETAGQGKTACHRVDDRRSC